MSNYEPNSSNAMFATILNELKVLNEKTDRIEAQTVRTNGRVSGIERWRDVVTAKTAGIALAVSAIVGIIEWVTK